MPHRTKAGRTREKRKPLALPTRSLLIELWAASAVPGLIERGMQIRSFGHVRFGGLVRVVGTQLCDVNDNVDGSLRSVLSSSPGV